MCPASSPQYGQASCLCIGVSTPLYPGSIHVLNFMYSLQHISHALTSYVDMCVHTCTYACTECLYLFFLFYKHKTISSHSILLFHHPWQVQLVLSRGPSPLHPLYFFPSLLAPVGVWTDPPSLDQWTLPCESQTRGHRMWQGILGSKWLPCSRVGGQQVFLRNFLKNMTKNIFFISGN